MELKDILQQIENVFDEHELIGNHDFSENEYSSMVDSVGLLCYKFISDRYRGFDEKNHKLIFVTLVEIAKRWKEYDSVEDNEENSGFGAIFSKH